MALMWWIPFRLFISRICYPGAHSFCSIRRLTDRGALVDTRAMALRKAGLAGEGLRLAVVAVAYFVSARLSLELALVHGQVTPVWPPTGIALVAILVFGVRIWPAIAVAALAVNLPLGPNVLGAACIAAGNTLAPLAAATLLKSVGFRLELDRLTDAAAVILLGALTGMAGSATGPFANESLLQKMVTLQTFNVFVALASLVLASYVETREREERSSRLYLSERLSNEAKSEFMRVAAHELRGPLSVLGGYLSLLSSGGLGATPQKWKGPLEILAAKTSELNDIMDDLLEVSRLDGDLMARTRASLDLHDVVHAAVERARPRAALTRGEIVAGKGQAITVMADADQLGHVMDNLINNALSYARPPARIAISSAIEAGRAVVRISDNGAGIPGGLRAGLFEPFRRGRQPGFEEVPGTGLGLYISRELATAHGGSLTLEKSAPGDGSTFALWLPLAAAPGQKATGSQQPG